VGYQTGLPKHPSGDVYEVLDGRGEAHGGQLAPRHLVALLRLITEGEKGLAAAGLSAGVSNRQHLLLAHVGPGTRRRGLGEGAVTAVVATELG
jgi:hypothetical protein